MKKLITILSGLTLAATAAVAAPQTANSSATNAAKATPPKPAAIIPARSIFTQPSSIRDGRDPFFPESTRAFDAANTAAVANGAPRNIEATQLAIKGVSRDARGRLMVIINNHTFMVGDEGDVLVTGGRAHLRCMEIRPDTVIVEVNGARHEIRY